MKLINIYDRQRRSSIRIIRIPEKGNWSKGPEQILKHVIKKNVLQFKQNWKYILKRHTFQYLLAARYISVEYLEFKKTEKKKILWASRQKKHMTYKGKRRNIRFHQAFWQQHFSPEETEERRHEEGILST